MNLRLLPTKSVEKVWGRSELPAPFVAGDGEKIGEIWFEPPAELDALLVKFLFTSEKLSVQCHPSDAQAGPGEEGKEECWLVLDAESDARIAIGLNEPVEADALRQAADDGSIEQLLTWHAVKAGNFFYLPAGTIHAIGGGLSIVEIQQNSDTTFRLFDYGRDRELHLQRGMDVAIRDIYPPEHSAKVGDASQTLVSGPHFRLDRVVGEPDHGLLANYTAAALVLPLSGRVCGDQTTVEAGQCAFTDEVSALDFSAAEITLIMRPA